MTIIRLILTLIIGLFLLIIGVGIVFAYKDNYKKRGKKNRLIFFLSIAIILSILGYYTYPYKKSDIEARKEKSIEKISRQKEAFKKLLEKNDYEKIFKEYIKLNEVAKLENQKLLEDECLEIKNRYMSGEITIEEAKDNLKKLGKIEVVNKISNETLETIEEKQWRENATSDILKEGITLEKRKKFKDAIEKYEEVKRESVDYDHAQKRIENLKKSNKTKNYIEFKDNIKVGAVAYIEKNEGMIGIFKIIEVNVDDVGEINKIFIQNMTDGIRSYKEIKDVEKNEYGLIYYTDENSF